MTYTEFVSKYVSSTYTVPATCADAKPTFYAQLIDQDPGRTDQFNGQYLSGVTVLKEEEDRVNYIPTTSDITKALLFTLEAGTGRLTEWPRGRYANVDGYFDFQLIGLNSAAYLQLRTGSRYLDCTLATAAGAEYIDCTVTNFWFLQYLQTCPLYQEYFDTPVVLGEEYSTDAPECFKKRIKVVKACVPKAG